MRIWLKQPIEPFEPKVKLPQSCTQSRCGGFSTVDICPSGPLPWLTRTTNSRLWRTSRMRYPRQVEKRPRVNQDRGIWSLDWAGMPSSTFLRLSAVSKRSGAREETPQKHIMFPKQPGDIACRNHPHHTRVCGDRRSHVGPNIGNSDVGCTVQKPAVSSSTIALFIHMA
jgi:hypothetical protein